MHHGRADWTTSAGDLDLGDRAPAEILDVEAPPSPATQITAGSTWYFQAWYRDPAAEGSSFDLTNGLMLTFAP